MATHIRTSKIVSDCKSASESKNVSFLFIKAPLKLGFWCFLIVVLELLQEVDWLILAISVDCWAQVRTSSTAKAWICVKLPASDLSFGAALDFPSAKFWICLSLDPQPDVHFAPQRGREINGKSSLLSNLLWGLVNFCHLFITACWNFDNVVAQIPTWWRRWTKTLHVFIHNPKNQVFEWKNDEIINGDHHEQDHQHQLASPASIV